MAKNHITRPRLKIFLSYARQDVHTAKEVFQRLQSLFDPWMDENALKPADDWRAKIKFQIEQSHVAILFLSKKSVNDSNFFLKEMELLIAKAKGIKVGDTSFLIPAFIEDFDLPDPLAKQLGKWHFLKLWEEDWYSRLLAALRARAAHLGMDLPKQPDEISSSTSPRKPPRSSLSQTPSSGRSPAPPAADRGDVIVFVPGFLGTALLYRATKGARAEPVWTTDARTLVTTLLEHEDRLKCDTTLEVGEVLPAVYFSEQDAPFVLYQHLFHVIQSLGYEEKRDFYPFGYDWRLSIRTNADLLEKFIGRVADGRPIKIIAHSMGGLIVRYMLASLGARNTGNMQSFIQIGTPVLGSSRVYYALKESAQLGDLCEWMEAYMKKYKKHNDSLNKTVNSFECLKIAMNSFKSVLELLPREEILQTTDLKLHSALHPDRWPDVDEARLREIQDLQPILESKVPSVTAIYSGGIRTDHIYKVDNDFKTIIKRVTEDGDGLALGFSATHQSTDRYRITRATHYVLPRHPDVLNIIKEKLSAQVEGIGA